MFRQSLGSTFSYWLWHDHSIKTLNFKACFDSFSFTVAPNTSKYGSNILKKIDFDDETDTCEGGETPNEPKSTESCKYFHQYFEDEILGLHFIFHNINKLFKFFASLAFNTHHMDRSHHEEQPQDFDLADSMFDYQLYGKGDVRVPQLYIRHYVLYS